jgi:hypothetical protein
MTGEVLFSENNYYFIPAEKGQNTKKMQRKAESVEWQCNYKCVTVKIVYFVRDG